MKQSDVADDVGVTFYRFDERMHLLVVWYYEEVLSFCCVETIKERKINYLYRFEEKD